MDANGDALCKMRRRSEESELETGERSPFMAYIMLKVFARAAINNTAVNFAADGCASNQTLMTARSFVLVPGSLLGIPQINWD